MFNFNFTMKMRKLLLLLIVLNFAAFKMHAQQRRPIDSRHPLWLVHIDIWNQADPQKIIDLIPGGILPAGSLIDDVIAADAVSMIFTCSSKL